VQDKKWESLETRLRLKQQGFLYPFSVLHNWQCQKWMKVKSRIKSRIKSNDLQKLVGKEPAVDHDCFDVGVVFGLLPFKTM